VPVTGAFPTAAAAAAPVFTWTPLPAWSVAWVDVVLPSLE
jgi:hypothetical protein